MTIQKDNKKSEQQGMVRLVLVGAVLGALAALIYGLFRRSKEPPR